MAPTPPPEFVAKLDRYDPELRIRWATRTSMWIIERKMEPRARQYLIEKPNPFKSQKGMDAYDGWKDGYVHVLTVHPDLLDGRVFEHLHDADVWAAGGMKRFLARADQWTADQEAEEDREITNWNQSASREFFDQFQWREGNRVAVTPPAEPPTIDTGLGFLVRDKRHAATEDALGSAD